MENSILFFLKPSLKQYKSKWFDDMFMPQDFDSIFTIRFIALISSQSAAAIASVFSLFNDNEATKSTH